MGGGIINSVAVAVDNVTLALNAGILQIKDAGVTAAKLAADATSGKILIEQKTIANGETAFTLSAGVDNTIYDYYEIDAMIQLQKTANSDVVVEALLNTNYASYDNVQIEGVTIVNNSGIGWISLGDTTGANMSSGQFLHTILKIGSKRDAAGRIPFEAVMGGSYGAVGTRHGFCTGAATNPGNNYQNIRFVLGGGGSPSFKGGYVKVYGVLLH